MAYILQSTEQYPSDVAYHWLKAITKPMPFYLYAMQKNMRST